MTIYRVTRRIRNVGELIEIPDGSIEVSMRTDTEDFRIRHIEFLEPVDKEGVSE